MLCGELRIEQREVFLPQTFHQMHETDLRSIGAPREHAFPEEGGTERYAIETSDEFIAIPGFYGMGMAHAVQGGIERSDRLVDPGARTIGRLLRASGHHGI